MVENVNYDNVGLGGHGYEMKLAGVGQWVTHVLHDYHFISELLQITAHYSHILLTLLRMTDF